MPPPNRDCPSTGSTASAASVPSRHAANHGRRPHLLHPFPRHRTDVTPNEPLRRRGRRLLRRQSAHPHPPAAPGRGAPQAWPAERPHLPSCIHRPHTHARPLAPSAPGRTCGCIPTPAASTAPGPTCGLGPQPGVERVRVIENDTAPPHHSRSRVVCVRVGTRRRLTAALIGGRRQPETRRSPPTASKPRCRGPAGMNAQSQLNNPIE
jgi:hypothetical protein